VASIRVRRGRFDRELLTRFHFRGRGLALARVEGPPREHGNTLLFEAGRSHAFFPKSDTVLTIAGSGGSGVRLFGTDFTAEDWIALGCDLEKLEVLTARDAGSGLTAYSLAPRDPASDSPWDSFEVWISADGTLVKSEFRSARRRLWRIADFEVAPGDAFPSRVVARTFSLDGSAPPSESELQVRFFEPDPPIDPALFRPENLRLWR
jgi:hypothetical protein